MFITILAGAFILSVVIIVHEWGHYIVAKKSGIFVKTFSIGFGRKLIKKKWGETVYTVSMLPFGGYVKFAGEGEEEASTTEAPQGDLSDEIPDSEIPPDRYFRNKSPLIRSAVVFAGPFMNYVLAVVLYIGMLAIVGQEVTPSTTVGAVTEGSLAEQSGIVPGDRIVEVNGEATTNEGKLVEALQKYAGTEKSLKIERAGETVEVTVAGGAAEGEPLGIELDLPARIGRVKRDSPAHRAGMRSGTVIERINDTDIASYGQVVDLIHASPETPLFIAWSLDGVQHADSITPEGKKVPTDDTLSEFEVVGQIGIARYHEYHRYPIHQAASLGFSYANDMIVTIVSFLKRLITREVPAKESLGGPILITKMAGDMARWSFNHLIYFLAFFSINLGIFNLLPLLPFDGGHLALFAYEGVARRPVNRRLKDIMTQAGFVLLIALMVLVVLLDLSRFTGSSPGLF